MSDSLPTPNPDPEPEPGQDSVDQLRAELAIARRQLDETRREMDAFAYSVSHDLRAPMRALSGFSKLLEDEARDSLSGDAADYLNRIVSATRRLEQLLDDLLTLARAGRAPLRPEPLDAGALARQIATELDAREPGRQVDWRIADLSVLADAALLRGALEQLLGNAFKFTRSRERPVIELIAEPCEADPPLTASGFSIRDNGVGFDMRYADRLFAPFQRLHPASLYEGNGIGLALVQRIARRHGGRAWIQAAPDQGAEAFVRLWESEPPPGPGG